MTARHASHLDYVSMTDIELGSVIETYPVGAREAKLAQAHLDARATLAEYARPDGGTRWDALRADTRAAMAADDAARVASLWDAGRTRGERDFASIAAPSGAGESIERVAHIAARDNGYGAVPRGVRRIERDARVAGIERRKRRAVMTQARAIERDRRASLPRDIEALTAIEEMRIERARGRYPLAGRTVIERVTIRDAKGISRGKTIIEARPAMVALEALTNALDRERQSIESIARHTPSGEGRGTVARAASSVNGTETRAATRWHGTPRHAVMTCIEERNGVRCVAPIDWHCYRIEADGTRTRLVSTATARRRKLASTVVSVAAARAHLASIAGTLGVEAQG